MSADYFASPGVNWSNLRHMRDSPAHYRYRADNPLEDRDAFRFGRLVHLLTLEPEKFGEVYAIWPEDAGRRAGKAWAAFQAEHDGREIIREQDLPPAQAVADAVRSHPLAQRLMSEGEAEQVIRWTDRATQIDCKAKIDWLRREDDHTMVVDLKVCRSTEHRRFAAAVHSLGYHGQLAHYAAGVEALWGKPARCFLIGVEREAPHDVGVFELDDGMPDGSLHVGRGVRRDLLRRLAQCIDADHWPGRSEEPQVLCLPSYGLPEPEITFGDAV